MTPHPARPCRPRSPEFCFASSMIPEQLTQPLARWSVSSTRRKACSGSISRSSLRGSASWVGSGASGAFDTLHDRLVSEVQRRAGDGAGGEMHTSRAIQLYGAGMYLEAIAVAGRALPLLAGQEWRATMLRALDVIADSYLQMGLPWAARGSWLVASALLGGDGIRQAEALPRLVYVLDRLRGVELRLGRLPESLSVHRLCEIVARATSVDDADLGEVLAEASVSYEAALAYALMRVPQTSLPRLARLPDALARLGLDVARGGLLLAMGHDVPASSTFPGLERLPIFFDCFGMHPRGLELT